MHRTTLFLCKINLCMFFGILLLGPKRQFCVGYSLYKMADFESGLISLIVNVFLSRFLHRTTLIWL